MILIKTLENQIYLTLSTVQWSNESKTASVELIMLYSELTRFPNKRLVLGDNEPRFLLINGRCRSFCFPLYWGFRLYTWTSKQKQATQRRKATVNTSKPWTSVETKRDTTNSVNWPICTGEMTFSKAARRIFERDPETFAGRWWSFESVVFSAHSVKEKSTGLNVPANLPAFTILVRLIANYPSTTSKWIKAWWKWRCVDWRVNKEYSIACLAHSFKYVDN